MTDRSRTWLATASLLLLPLLWLWPCVFGDRTFVPYDLAEFPPASQALAPADLDAVRAGKNHDVTEVAPWFLPEMVLARDELMAGRWPLWNPHARGGAPLHAHGLIGLCYPPNWIALFADEPGSRLVFLAWISLALGGLLTFGLLRELGVAMAAAWFGAALFELSAPMAVNAFFWMRLASFVWLPGVLWALLRLAKHDTLRPGPLAAVAGSFAMAWLGGFPPFATTTSVIGGLLAAWLVVARWREISARAAARLALRLGLGTALGAMLAMPQVLPSLQFFPQSARTPNPPLAAIGNQSFEAYGLLGYLLPDLISHPTATHEIPYHRSPLALLLGTRHDDTGKQQEPIYNYTEYAVFVGTFGFLLALAGAFAGRGRLRAFAISTFVLLLCLALFVPGVHLLFVLPVLKNVWPMRWLAPATLFVAWFAALGLARLREPTKRLPLALGSGALLLAAALGYGAGRPAAWYAASPAAVVEHIAARFACTAQDVVNFVQDGAPAGMDRFALAFARAAEQGLHGALWLAAVGALLLGLSFVRHAAARTWLLGLACATTIVQLGLHGAPIVRGCELAHPTDTAVHAFLAQRAAEAAPTGGFAVVRASKVPMLPIQLPPGELMVPGLRDLHFYTHYDGRSFEPLLAMFGAHWGPRIAGKGYLELSLPDQLPVPGEPPGASYGFPSPLGHPLLDLLGVRYVLATERLMHAGPVVGPTLGDTFFVHERPHPLPRAFTVPALRTLPTDADVVAALVDAKLDPRAAALVRQADAPAAPATATAAPGRAVRFTADHPTVVELDVEPGAHRWIVLTDTFLPGWTATVGGQPAAIVRANHCQRAVQIPEAACTVRFVYGAPGLAAGLGLAGIATLALLASVFHHRRRRAAGTAR